MLFTFALFAYLVVGALAGILGGLLGIGGGVITVPCLYFLFGYLGYPQTYVMHLAIGTSLAAMIFNTTASTWAHNKRQGVSWQVFKKMAPGLALGSIAGALVAKWLSGVLLEIFFGIFMCVLAYYFWRNHPIHEEEHRLPHTAVLMACSAVIGIISNILGLGGGTFVMPFLMAFKMPVKKAIGTSAASSLLVTSIGAISFLILGWDKVLLPEDVGYIDLPAFIVIGLISFLVAPYGVKWAHTLPVKRIRKIFACVLLITGLSMIIF